MMRKLAAVLALVILGLGLYLAIGRRPADEPHFRPINLEPEETYHLTLWDYDYPFRAEEYPSYTDFIEDALENFAALYPNIKVEYRLLSINRGQEELKEALAAGKPPDVYGSWWERPALPHELRVPSEPYWSEEDDASYIQTAASLSRNAGLWPRLVHPRGLLANGPAESLALPSEFTWQHLCQYGAGKLRLVVNNSRGDFLSELILVQGEGEGGPYSRLLKAATFVEELKQSRLIEEESGKMYLELLDSFLSEEPVLAGGLNPVLAAFLLDSDPAARVLPLLVPEGIPNRPVAMVDGYTVYRQDPYRGDHTTQAAVHLARYLSQFRSSVFQWASVPAYIPELGRWSKKSDRNAQLASLLEGTRAVLFQPFEVVLGLNLPAQQLRPVLQEFWDGRIPPGLLLRELQRAGHQ